MDLNPNNRPLTDQIIRSSFIFDRVVKIQVSDSNYGNVLKPSEKIEFNSIFKSASRNLISNSIDKSNEEFLHYWNLKDNNDSIAFDTSVVKTHVSISENPKIINLECDINDSNNHPQVHHIENSKSNIDSIPVTQSVSISQNKNDPHMKSLNSWLSEVESMADKIQSELSDKSPARLFVHNSVRVPQTEPKSRKELPIDYNTPENKNKPLQNYTPEIKQLSTPSAHLKLTPKIPKNPITLSVKVKPVAPRQDIATPVLFFNLIFFYLVKS